MLRLAGCSLLAAACWLQLAGCSVLAGCSWLAAASWLRRIGSPKLAGCSCSCLAAARCVQLPCWLATTPRLASPCLSFVLSRLTSLCLTSPCLPWIRLVSVLASPRLACARRLVFLWPGPGQVFPCLAWAGLALLRLAFLAWAGLASPGLACSLVCLASPGLGLPGRPDLFLPGWLGLALAWPFRVCPAWPRQAGSTWPRLPWSSLGWPGPAWPGPAWPGFVFSLAWTDLA